MAQITLHVLMFDLTNDQVEDDRGLTDKVEKALMAASLNGEVVDYADEQLDPEEEDEDEGKD